MLRLPLRLAAASVAAVALIGLAASPASAASSWTTSFGTYPNYCSTEWSNGKVRVTSCVQIQPGGTKARAVTKVKNITTANHTYQLGHEVRTTSATGPVVGGYSSNCPTTTLFYGTQYYCVGPWSTVGATQKKTATVSFIFVDGVPLTASIAAPTPRTS